MKIMTTQAELRNTKHEPGIYFLCDACKQSFPVQTSGGTGYGYRTRDDDAKPVCYSCMDKLQIEDLKDRSKPFCAYVGKGIITTWTGGKLMTITKSRHCRLTRQSFTHDRRSYMSIHAVDVHGGHWAGRGSEGIVIKLRPVKG